MVNTITASELKESLDDLLKIEDEIIYNFYYKNVSNKLIANNKVASILKKFKIK